MKKFDKLFDVFISHSMNDAAFALEVAKACRAGGLEAVTDADFLSGEDVGDALREALTESRAFLAILSPSEPTSLMAIEIGAVRAWNKPIFAVVTDPSLTRLPPALSGVPLYTIGRIEEVI